MRREKRPFVVEVKRGAKRAPAAPNPLNNMSFDDAIQRAESALFGDVEAPVDAPAAPAFPETAPPAVAQPPRRILEALPADEPVEAAFEPEAEAEPKRRGRKPGSKNRPRSVDAPPLKRRGRPPKSAGGAVRSVPVTAAIAGEALTRIASVAPPPPAPTGSRTLFQTQPSAPPPAKRGRGRPRKIVPEGPIVPAWVLWAESDEPEAAPSEPEIAALAPAFPPPTVVARTEEHVLARSARIRPGMRWTRRLRGAAAIARMRRQRIG